MFPDTRAAHDIQRRRGSTSNARLPLVEQPGYFSGLEHCRHSKPPDLVRAWMPETVARVATRRSRSERRTAARATPLEITGASRSKTAHTSGGSPDSRSKLGLPQPPSVFGSPSSMDSRSARHGGRCGPISRHAQIAARGNQGIGRQKQSSAWQMSCFTPTARRSRRRTPRSVGESAHRLHWGQVRRRSSERSTRHWAKEPVARLTQRVQRHVRAFRCRDSARRASMDGAAALGFVE